MAKRLHHILTNPIYAGRIRHREEVHEGQHPAIIDPDLWQTVQNAIQRRASKARGTSQKSDASPLAGKLWDATSNRLTPSHAIKQGTRYRYYVSSRLIRDPRSVQPEAWRLPADPLEQHLISAVRDRLARPEAAAGLASELSAAETRSLALALQHLATRLSGADAQQLLGDLVVEARLGAGTMSVQLDSDGLIQALDLDRSLSLTAEQFDPASLSLKAPLPLRRRGVEAKLRLGPPAPKPDRTLIRHLLQARNWYVRLTQGESLSAITASEGLPRHRVHLILDMALLAPDLLEKISDGGQPSGLTTQ